MKVSFNNPESWLTETIHTAPPIAIKDYQERINAICGTYSGKPNVLLTWCPDMTNYSRYYCEWDTAGFGTKTHLRGQYVYETLYDKDDNPIDVPPPRWALKQLVHPAQYLQTDNITRWTKQSIGQQTKVREMRPPRGDHGYYSPMLSMGKHNGQCCADEKKIHGKCWGKYREPDEAYLSMLKKAVHIRDSEKNVQRADEPLTHETLLAAASEAATEIKLRNDLASKRLDNLLDNYLPELVADFTKDNTFIERKKEYSLPPQYKETSSGLVVPK